MSRESLVFINHSGKNYTPLFSTVCDDGTTLVLAFSKDDCWVIARQGKVLQDGSLSEISKAAAKYLDISATECVKRPRLQRSQA